MGHVTASTTEVIKCFDEQGEFTVYAGGFPLDVENKDLDEIFSKYGNVRGYFPMNRHGKFSGVVFVKYETREMAEKCIKALNESKYGNRYLKVKIADSSRPPPKKAPSNEPYPNRGDDRRYDDYPPPRRPTYDDYPEERRDRYPEEPIRSYPDRRYDEPAYEERRYPNYREDDYPQRYPSRMYDEPPRYDERRYSGYRDEELPPRRYPEERRPPSPPRQYVDDYDRRYPPDERDPRRDDRAGSRYPENPRYDDRREDLRRYPVDDRRGYDLRDREPQRRDERPGYPYD